jgi:hypothetical protein
MKFLGQTRQSGTERFVLSPGERHDRLWLFETGPAQMKAISREGLTSAPTDSFVLSILAFIFLCIWRSGACLFGSIFLPFYFYLYSLINPPLPLFTVGCIIYSIVYSKGRKEVLHTKNEGRVVGLFHILHRNCLLKQVTEEKKGGMGRRGKRHEQL